MKKILITLTLMLGFAASMSAQKFVLVDMEYILKNIPAYERANEQLNQVSKKWQAEVEALTNEAQKLYKTYQSEAVFLSQEEKTRREEAIVAKEKEASELKRKYFGTDGQLFRSARASWHPYRTRYTMPSRTSVTRRATRSSSTVPRTLASSMLRPRLTSATRCC